MSGLPDTACTATMKDLRERGETQWLGELPIDGPKETADLLLVALEETVALILTDSRSEEAQLRNLLAHHFGQLRTLVEP